VKNNLVEICENSDTNSDTVCKCVQKNTGSVSFSDSRSDKRSAVQNINTKMEVLIKCMNLEQSNSAETLNTTTSYRCMEHSKNKPKSSRHNLVVQSKY